MKKIILVCLFGLLGTGCTGEHYLNSLDIFIPALYSKDLNLDFQGPLRPNTAPGNSDFDCMRINVVGQGIPDSGSGQAKDALADEIAAGKVCAYPGIISDAIPVTTASKVTLQVPAGVRRTIQVVGIDDAGTGEYPYCGAGRIKECNTAGCVKPKLYELGRAVVGFSSAMTVAITNTYKDLTTDAAREERRVNCGDSTGGGSPGGGTFTNYVGVFGGTVIKIFKLSTATEPPQLQENQLPLNDFTVTDAKVDPDGNMLVALVGGVTRYVHLFKIFSDGKIHPSYGSNPTDLGSSAGPIAVSHNCIAVLNAPSAGNFTVFQYGLNAVGDIDIGTKQEITTGETTQYNATFSRGGGFLYIKSLYSASTHNIKSYSIDAGTCTPTLLNTLDITSPLLGATVKSLLLNPFNSKLFVVATNKTLIYDLSASMVPVVGGGSPETYSGFFSIDFADSFGESGLLLASETSTSLRMAKYENSTLGTSGLIQVTPTSSFTVKAAMFSRDDKWVFALHNEDSGTLGTFLIDNTNKTLQGRGAKMVGLGNGIFTYKK